MMMTEALKSYTLRALQKSLNHALALDELSAPKICALEGKCLKIIIAPLNVHFFILFQNHKIHLKSDTITLPDTVIHSSPLGVIRLSLLPSSKVRSLFNDQIRISGDVQVGQQVKKLFDELQIDWEGHLAHFTGDVVAHQIGSFVRHSWSIKQRMSDSFRKNLSDYVHDESRLLPSRQELEDFYTAIDALSLTVERLAAHINQVTQSKLAS